MSILIEVTILTLGIALVLAVITRVLTNPKEMKNVKLEMEFFKEKVNIAQKEGNKDDVKKYTDSMMSTSKKQFSLSMKSLIVTMIVVIIALGYIHQTYDGIKVQKDNPVLSYNGEEIPLTINEEDISIDLNKDGNPETYKYGELVKYSEREWIVQKQGEEVLFSLIIAKSPFTLPFLGSHLNWFWFYVILSIPCSMLFRKFLGVEQ